MAKPKLFIFAIGGTGSRVVKSLTYLLATGINIKADKIIPIFIDPDNGNGDLNRTLKLIQSYQHIRNSLKKEVSLVDTEKGNFFSPELVNWNQLTQKGDTNDVKEQGFKWDMVSSDQSTFEDFINFIALEDEDKNLIRGFFSERDLRLNLEVGFKGNPHIGSIVLNQFMQDSENLSKFTNNFSTGDRIFIIGSIFGGTGAAGLPLLVKNIRKMEESTNNKGAIQNAVVGAVVALPYFGVNSQADAEINSSQFISKTKAALHYYGRTLKTDIDVTYYVGDPQKSSSSYEYAVGQKAQKNNANFIELVSALAIIDFMDDPDLGLESDAKSNSIFKEFSIEKGSDNSIDFNHLSSITKKKLFKSMTTFHLAYFYLNNQFENSVKKEKPPWLSGEGGTKAIEASFLTADFYPKLQFFLNEYKGFLDELSSNIARSFTPFKLDIKPSELATIVNGIMPEKKKFLGKDMDENYLTHLLNEAHGKEKSKMEKPEQKLFFYLNLAMQNAVNEKYKSLVE